MLQRTGLKSNLTVPIAVGGRHVLVLATGAVREFRAWPDEVVERVRLVGQILASALSMGSSSESAPLEPAR